MVNIFPFKEATEDQIPLLNEYRLTSVFRDAYGAQLLDTLGPKDVRVKTAIRRLRLSTGNPDVTIRSHRKQIADMLYTHAVLGFRMFEYAAYGLEQLTPSERTEFLSEAGGREFYKKLNPDMQAREVCRQKYLTYQTIPHAFQRDIILITGPESKQNFFHFCEKHPELVVKPNTGTLGKGIRFYSQNDFPDTDTLFNSILSEYEVTSDNALVCEEPIVQHPITAQFHEHSVNTFRIFTYFDDVDAHIICAWFKAGKDGAIVDNGSAGGMIAAIDCCSGVICTDAADETARIYPEHPNTLVRFKGVEIGLWNEMVACVKEWAAAFPKLRVVGWDVALSKDKGIQLVEANAQGMVNLIQVATRKGFLREFAEKVEWHRYQ